MIFNKKKLLGGIAVLSSFMLAACGNSTDGNSTEGTDLSVSETQWDKIEEKGVWKVATSGTLFPSSYHGEDNELTGYEIEVVKKIADRLDVEIEFMEMGVDGMLTAVQSGQVDAAANGFDITAKREEDYLFADPYKYSFGGLVVRTSDDSGIKTMEDWEGKKAAGGATTTYMTLAKQLGAEPVTYDNATNDIFFRDVASERTDFIPNDYYVSNTAVQKFADLGVKMSDLKYNPSEQGIVLSKDDSSVKEKIDPVIAELNEEGILAELSKQFFGGEDVSQPLDNVDDLPVIEIKE
ncbi:transporter substrate-binding domain-containing protein [Jeotgalibaca sp. MA1X17-3]|uniref:transporter substrate-binding domain-containing protein n=1 Tax=Jeotgalibaca sp. MA1X17-3 TaxID=2908211 RepID=UPI001F2E7616|nr:transporter substrate-binding domain-containing protein [Jeotgalibaca sp. MA1X17-3]UJF15362.1 transporter substrate-binding domain-containing protein [Jeotgalibaca sp. MA1X17-3]